MAGPLPRGGADGRPAGRTSWPMRVAWFVGLWLAGIAVIGAVAWIIRFWLVG